MQWQASPEPGSVVALRQHTREDSRMPGSNAFGIESALTRTHSIVQAHVELKRARSTSRQNTREEAQRTDKFIDLGEVRRTQDRLCSSLPAVDDPDHAIS